MKDILNNLSNLVEEFGASPTFAQMPRRTLADKGVNGPTAAHVIEEIHTPLNLAFVTFTTGSSAFQNIVGVTHQEMPSRIKAARNVFERSGVQPGHSILFTYPPLVNVFTNTALSEYGVGWSFLKRSSRDALLAAVYDNKPNVIVGESAFLRSAFADAKKMGIIEYLPRGLILLVAGTPLDLELLPVAESIGAKVCDLYGCQEFGWLALNGVNVRDDITLLPTGEKAVFEFVVGGLPTGDSFVIAESGHVLDSSGKIITYRRKRTYPEYEVFIKAVTLASEVTAARAARTILRIKGRVVKVHPDLQTGAQATVLELRPSFESDVSPVVITGPVQTTLFDELMQAQLDYQQTAKNDPVWIKER